MTDTHEKSTSIQKLKGAKNFQIWQIRMKAVLTEKGLEGSILSSSAIVLDEASEPTGGPQTRSSRQPVSSTKSDSTTKSGSNDAKALAYIHNNIEDGPLLLIYTIPTAAEAWNMLHTLYGNTGFTSTASLYNEFHATTLNVVEGSMEQYVQRLKRISTELEALSAKLHPNQIAALALGNLTNDYDAFIAVTNQSIRASKSTEVDLDMLYANLLDESRRLDAKSSLKEETMALSATSDPASGSGAGSKPKKAKNNPQCNHCKQKGRYSRHLEARCWDIHPELRPKPKEDISDDADVTLTATIALHTDTSQITPWILDSGAGSHICSDLSLFSQPIEEKPGLIHLGKAKSIPSLGSGSVKLKFSDTNRGATLQNCLLVPELGINLISVKKLTESGCSITFLGQNATIHKNGSLITTAVSSKGLWYIQNGAYLDQNGLEQPQVLTSDDSRALIHARFGHIGENAMKQLEKHTIGTPGTLPNSVCPACASAKITAMPNHIEQVHVTTYLQKVWSDLFGPISFDSKKQYYISFIDEATRFAEIAIIGNKDGAFTRFKEFKTLAEHQSSAKIKELRTDRGLEYLNKEFTQICKDSGILFTHSAAYAHEQMGIAERFNRTILDKVRAMLFQAGLDHSFWGKAVTAAVYLYNRTPHSGLDFITPYEKRYQKAPDISHIRIWGSTTYAKIDSPESKLHSRAKKGILIGYGVNQYEIFNPETGHVYWSRDVLIDEKSVLIKVDSNELTKVGNEDFENHDNVSADFGLGYAPKNAGTPDSDYVHDTSPDLEDSDISDEYSDDELALPALIKSKDKLITIDSKSVPMDSIPIPSTYREAIESTNATDWTAAMQREIDALDQNKTWILTDLPPDRKALRGRWVFATKPNKAGPLFFKARWVAKGFTQQEGVDYASTFAATLQPISYRIIFAVVAELGLVCHQVDVDNAFTTAPLEEDIYIQQPIGFHTAQSGSKICKLQKALYGLKQAAFEWAKLFTQILEDIGFTQSKVDDCIFTMGNAIILTYVDDALIIHPDLAEVERIKKALGEKVKIKDLGEVNYFLGMAIIRDLPKREISMSQSLYSRRILVKYGYSKLNSATTPMEHGLMLEPNQNQATSAEINRFQQEVGSLIYLITRTRPDLAQSVVTVARYMANPNSSHRAALKRIWRYLAGTTSYQMRFKAIETKPELTKWVDSDWGGDQSRRSTTGLIIMINSMPIVWQSKLQKTIALSSAQAEYQAMRDLCKEVMWINQLLNTIPLLSHVINSPIAYSDSQAAISISENSKNHQKTKHIDIIYHFVRECVKRGIIHFHHVPTADQIADGFTKALTRQKFDQFVQLLDMKNV
jgi:hypothetical protein